MMNGGLMQAPPATGVPQATVSSLPQESAVRKGETVATNTQTVETRDNAVSNIFEGTSYTRDDAAFLLNAITTALLAYVVLSGGFD
jgi:hypothetical protein